MKALFTLTAVAAALAVTTAAQPAPTRWSQMTAHDKQAFLVKTIRQDQGAIRWWLNHRPAPDPPFFTVPPVGVLPCRALTTPAPLGVCYRAGQLAHAQPLLARIDRLLRAEAVPYWPPHHKLWTCIAPFEGAHTSSGAVDWHTGEGTSNKNTGGLAMERNWGYGLTGSAADYSEHDQEWAAERAFAASGYSWSFLNDAWYQYDSADGCGTTG